MTMRVIIKTDKPKKRKGLFLPLLIGGAVGYAAYKFWDGYLREEHVAEDMPEEEDPALSEDIIKAKGIIGKRGEEARFMMFGVPGKGYDITVYNPSQGTSVAGGQDWLKADARGYCEWNWSVGNNTTTGNGRIVVEDEDGRKWTFGYMVVD